MSALPVRSLTLYKNKVGFFERHGEVEGDAVVAFNAKKEEIGSVVKSLTVVDLSETGAISSVTYEGNASQMVGNPFHAKGPDATMTLIGLLGEIRGAGVSMSLNNGSSVKGTVCGTQSKRGDSGMCVEYVQLLLQGSQELVRIDLGDVKGVQMESEQLRRDYASYLGHLLRSGTSGMKRVEVFCKGEGKRNVVASYVGQANEWRVSYRLFMFSGPKQEDPTAPTALATAPPHTRLKQKKIIIIQNEITHAR